MRAIGIDRVWRYVFGELVGPTLLGLCVYVLVFLMNAIFELAELAIKRDVPIGSAVLILFFFLPRILVMAIPMATLLGVLVGIGRLSADSEIIALRAAGASYWRVLYPALILGVLGWLVCSWMILQAEPEANYRRHRIFDELVYSSDLRRQIKPRVFFEEIPGAILYADEVHENGDFLERVFLYQSGPDGKELLTLARRAQIEYEPRTGVARFFLEDGTTHGTVPAEAENYQVSRFDKQMIQQAPDESFRVRSSLLARPRPKNYREQTLDELARTVASADAIAHPETRDRVIGSVLAVLHEKFSMPLACVVFALIGVPLGVMNRRGGRASGFTISIAIAIAYWIMHSAGQNLVNQGKLSPYIGLWLGNAILGVLGIVLFIMRERSEEFRLRPLLGTRLQGLLGRIPGWAGRGWGMRKRILSGTAQRSKKPRRILSPPRHASGTDRLPDSVEDDFQDTRSRRPWIRAVAIIIGILVALYVITRPRGPILVVALGVLAILLVFSSRIDRYVLEKFGLFFVAAVGSLYFLLAVYEFINLIDDLVERDLAFTIVLDYLKYRSPWILSQVLPMSCLMAMFLTFGILIRFNEVTAMKSGGMSIYRMTAPVMIAVLAISMFAYLNHDYLEPRSSQKAAQLKDTIRGRSARSYAGKERRWVFGEDGRLYNFRAYVPGSRFPVLGESGTGTFQGMSVYLFDQAAFQVRQRIYARTAVHEGGHWVFHDGWLREFSGSEESFETFTTRNFDFRELPAYFVREWKTPQQMNYRELNRFVGDLKRRGYDVQELTVDLYDKTAFPLVSFTIVLLGLPFCFRMGKRGSLYGVGVGVLLVVVYLLVFSTTNSLGGIGLMPAFLAAWAPNILFSGTGIYMLLRTPT
jgi:LPS export ABC transporter permease LptF/LPS export ABC transporter permease LptG